MHLHPCVLFAPQDLPQGFVLGPLAGYVVPSDIAHAELATAPMHQDLRVTPERWRFECAR